MIAYKLKEIRERTGMNKKEFSKYLDIKYTTYNGYETGAREPASDFLILVSKKFDVSIDYLMGLKDDADILHSYPLSSLEFSHIENYRCLDDYGKKTVDLLLKRELERYQQFQQPPITISETPGQYGDNIIPMFTTHKKILHRTGAAGAGIGEITNNIETVKIDYPADKVPEGTDYTIDVTGDSMEPTYSDGDVLFCERGDNNLHFGDIGIFIIDGDTLVKEYGEDGLLSHNKKYDIIKINDGQSFKVEGKVLGKL
ncbi:MAG: XRE family transcriptional regulator [Eubacterium sp.]